MQVSSTILSIQRVIGRPLSPTEKRGVLSLENLWIPEGDLAQRINTLFEGDERTSDISTALFKARKPQIIQDLLKEMQSSDPNDLNILKDQINQVMDILNNSSTVKGIITLAKHVESLHDLASNILPSFEKRSRITRDSINPINSGRLFVNGAINCNGMMRFCEAVDTFLFLPNGFCIDDDLGEGKVNFWERVEYKTEEIAIANIDFLEIKPSYNYTLGHVRGDIPNFVYFFPALIEKLSDLELQLFKRSHYSSNDLFSLNIQEMLNSHEISNNDYLTYKKAFVLGEELSHAKDGIDLKKSSHTKEEQSKLIKKDSPLYRFFFKNPGLNSLLQQQQMDDLDIVNSIVEISGKARCTATLMGKALQEDRESEAKFYALMYFDSILHRFTPRNRQFIDAQSYLTGEGTCFIFGEKSPVSLYETIKDLPTNELFKRVKSAYEENCNGELI